MNMSKTASYIKIVDHDLDSAGCNIVEKRSTRRGELLTFFDFTANGLDATLYIAEFMTMEAGAKRAVYRVDTF
jgi:hypothetical protein